MAVDTARGHLDMRNEHVAGTTVLEARGELDLVTAPELCRGVERATVGRTELVLDLSGLTTCDTRSVRALIGVIQEAGIRMCEIVVIAPRGCALDRVLDATGTREVLRTARTRSAGVSALR
jgi:anti-anti-sigma factor